MSSAGTQLGSERQDSGDQIILFYWVVTGLTSGSISGSVGSMSISGGSVRDSEGVLLVVILWGLVVVLLGLVWGLCLWWFCSDLW